MSDSFQLRLVTPSKQVLDEPVREVTAPGVAGEFGVLPEHITFLGALDVGAFTYRTDRGSKRLALKGGFAEFLNEVMTVLADAAAFPEEIDVEAARREASEAEAALQGVSQYDPAYRDLDVAYRWARTKLEVAGAR